MAPPARLAGSRGVGGVAPGITRPAGRGRPHRLEPGERGCGQGAGKKGGELTGPNPTDRGKPGVKRHIAVERGGLPLAKLLTGANRHESMVFEELLDAIPPIMQPNGRRRKRPDKGHADKA